MLITVHGTWSSDLTGEWYDPGSPAMVAVAALGVQVWSDPFQWSGDLGTGLNRRPWEIGAKALRWYLRSIRVEGEAPFDVISHSHGIQVLALGALTEGLRFGRILDVEGPVVPGLDDAYDALRAACAHWQHTWNRGDRVLLAGEAPTWRPAWENPRAHENTEIPEADEHSGLFTDIPHWATIIRQFAPPATT